MKFCSCSDSLEFIFLKKLIISTCCQQQLTNSGGYDGTEYSVNPANVDITIKPTNDPRVVNNIYKTGVEDDIVFISTQDFIDNFNSVNGYNLTSVTILSLPNHGKLRILNTDVVINQELDVSSCLSCINCAILNFLPDTNWNGNTGFVWKGYDGFIYSNDNDISNVNINISAINDVPIVNDVLKIGTKGVATKFFAEDFINSFFDIENDLLIKIKVTSLPESGILKLSNKIVATNQEISVESLENLTFIPTSNWIENVTFYWQGYDGVEYSSNTAEIKITVVSANKKIGKIAAIVGSVVGFIFFVIARKHIYEYWNFYCVKTHSFARQYV